MSNDFRVSDGKNYDWHKNELNQKYHKIFKDINKAVNYDFIGFDLVLDSNNLPYILEVNYPNNFAPMQTFLNIDIAYEALSYLKTKTEKIANKV